MKLLNGFQTLGVLIAVLYPAASGQVSVVTQRNDNLRSGVNLSETLLTTSNVNVKTFGKLFTAKVDGYIFAQPLYLSNLSIAGGIHNVIYVATAADSVFAFDADNGSLLWSRNYGKPVPSSVIGTENILVQVGIISTPVIDPSTQTMYVVTKTYENNVQLFRLHALDITTGSEKLGGPVVISASVNGSGSGNDGNGHVTFQAAQENQRVAVTLANGVIYLAFASHEDLAPYHGWVLGYSASTLTQLYVFNDTPNGSAGGIWQSGQGLLVDANTNLYFMVGNGTADAQSGGSDFGEGFIKLSANLTPLDYFIPNDFDNLNSRDLDVSSGGPISIPGTPYIAGEGKQGVLYVVDTTNMGHYNASQNPIHQQFTVGKGIWGSPLFWNNASSPTLYVWNNADVLKAFRWSNGFFQTSPAAQGSIVLPGGALGGALALSSNGNASGTNILWASVPLQDPDHALSDSQLIAYDATNVANELWNTRQNQARDDVGNWAKFVAPTVANGKVYMATHSGQLVVYGLLGSTGGNPGTTSIDDDAEGTGQNEFNYAGAWQHCSNCGSNLYNQSNSWDNTPNDFVTVAFSGAQIKLFGVQDINHGIGAVSIDGGPEINVDFYGSTRAGNVLLWTSPILASGSHTLKLRVTGTHSAASTDNFVVPDRVDISSGNSANPSTPTGLSATPGNGQISLSWLPSSGAISYNLYRATTSGAEGSTPIASGVVGTTYTNTNLTNGATYYYTVAASNSAGMSAQSAEASAMPNSGAALGDGTYTVTNLASKLVWDDPAFAKIAGTKVILWPANGGANQRWKFTSAGNGYYTITNQNSGLVLDDANVSTAPGTELIQWPSNNGRNQLWLITPVGDGYTITNQASQLVVDASGNAKGTNLQQSTTSGGAAQVWLIQTPRPSSVPTVFRPSSGTWYSLASGGSPAIAQWGLPNDVPLLADYAGSGQKDFAVWRPSTGDWYVLPNGNPTAPMQQEWGLPGDIPVPGDFDGDAAADFAVWRPANGVWYVLPSSDETKPVVQQWGILGDRPVSGDFDGDGKTDLAVWRPSNGVWYILGSANPQTPIIVQWGLPGDIPIAGDYDGDGESDLAVWRPSEGNWYILLSSTPGTPVIKQWGLPGDIPVPGDYDGDGTCDLAVWRPSEGNWYILPSSTAGSSVVQQWGLPGDIPANRPVW
jgi:hypothetical protein